MSTRPASSTWYTRDYPVLVSAAERLDQDGRSFQPTALVEAVEISTEDISRAVVALIAGGYLVGDANQGFEDASPLVSGLTAEGRRASGLWPNREEHLASLIAALQEAEENTDDPEKRSIFKRAGDSLVGVPAAVLSVWLSGQIT